MYPYRVLGQQPGFELLLEGRTDHKERHDYINDQHLITQFVYVYNLQAMPTEKSAGVVEVRFCSALSASQD